MTFVLALFQHPELCTIMLLSPSPLPQPPTCFFSPNPSSSSPSLFPPIVPILPRRSFVPVKLMLIFAKIFGIRSVYFRMNHFCGPVKLRSIFDAVNINLHANAKWKMMIFLWYCLKLKNRILNTFYLISVFFFKELNSSKSHPYYFFNSVG